MAAIAQREDDDVAVAVAGVAEQLPGMIPGGTNKDKDISSASSAEPVDEPACHRLTNFPESAMVDGRNKPRLPNLPSVSCGMEQDQQPLVPLSPEEEPIRL